MARVVPKKSKVYHGGVPYTDYESYSSISKWLKCPVTFAQSYWTHIAEPSSLPLIFGNAFHGLVEDSLIHKQLSGDVMELSAARSRWEQRWVMEKKLAEDGRGGLRIDKESPENLFSQGLECTDVWIKNWLPKIEPRDIEQQFILTLRDLPRTIYGRLDFTENDGTLDDLKTSGRPYNDAKSEYELQFAIYHVGYFSLYHAWPKKADIVRVETSRSADIQRFDMSLTRERVQELFDTVVRPAMVGICESWKTGMFICDSKKCGKHESLDWFVEDKKIQAALEAQRLADERILDPEKYAKDHAEELLQEALKANQEQRERVVNEVDPDTIPF